MTGTVGRNGTDGSICRRDKALPLFRHFSLIQPGVLPAPNPSTFNRGALLPLTKVIFAEVFHDVVIVLVFVLAGVADLGCWKRKGQCSSGSGRKEQQVASGTLGGNLGGFSIPRWTDRQTGCAPSPTLRCLSTWPPLTSAASRWRGAHGLLLGSHLTPNVCCCLNGERPQQGA